MVFKQNVCWLNWITHNYLSTGSSCVPLVVWNLAIFVRENWAFGVSSQMIYEYLVWSISHTSKTVLARGYRSMLYYCIRKLTWNLSTFFRKEHYDIIHGKYIKKAHNEISISSTKQVLIIHPSCPTLKWYRIIVFFKKHIKTKFITFHIYHNIVKIL